MSDRIPRLAIDLTVACIAVLLLSGGAAAPRLVEGPTEVWLDQNPINKSHPSNRDADRLDRLFARVAGGRR